MMFSGNSNSSSDNSVRGSFDTLRGANTSNNTMSTIGKDKKVVSMEEWNNLKSMYEDEKSKRMELETLAKSLAETLNNLKTEVTAMKEANEKLMSR